MHCNYTAYIDEAGDEGLGKLRQGGTGQSRWLLLGGILVREEIERELTSWRDEIVALFPTKKSRDLHFRELDHNQKVAATHALATKRLGICCVCSNKATLTDSPTIYERFKAKGHLYRYLTRYLLERLTASVATDAKRLGGTARLSIVFSRRANTDYHAMREYLELMRDGKEKMPPVRSIDWSVFDPADIRVENHSRWAGLQIADVATSATFSALEPNRYGFYESRYALALAKRFISTANQGILDCGLTLVPWLSKNPLDTAQREFVDALIERWRAPGP